MLNMGTFVFMTGRVDNKKWGDGLEFHISNMELLADVKGKKNKSSYPLC